MVLHKPSAARRGVHAVEFAVVAPVLFFLVISQLAGGIAIFNYVEMASLSREGSRWASVHGYQYQQDKSVAQTTAADVYTNAIAPRAVLLDLTGVNATGPFSYSVSWTNSYQQAQYYDTASSSFKTNYVTVQVSYRYSLAFVGSITLTSRSTVAMSY